MATTRRSQQPGVALETTKEHRVALATDETRGYPDNNETGIHLAKPRRPSDMWRQQRDEKDDVKSVTILPLYFLIYYFFYLITFIAKQIYILKVKAAPLQARFSWEMVELFMYSTTL